jgi:preprotein translocase subunit SecA
MAEADRRAVARRLALVTIDRCWSDHLAEARALQDDSHLLAFGGKYPLAEFQRQIGDAFPALVERIEDDARASLDALVIGPSGVDWEKSGLRGPSATWTYLIGENPFEAAGWLSPSSRPQVLFAAAALAPLFVLNGLAVLWQRLKDRRGTKAA